MRQETRMTWPPAAAHCLTDSLCETMDQMCGAHFASTTTTTTTTTTMAAHVSDLPAELSYSPVPLVALFGLQPATTPDHAAVWEGFTANRLPDRVPMYYKFCSDADVLTPPKSKKNSYEWYIPKGILKTAWVRKHLFEVPAVAVLFFDLDFDDAQWLMKEDECAAKVDQVRRQLNGRQSRLAVVLIQRSASLPSDQSLASERAAQLCTKSSLPANCLFVLPITEQANHLQGFFYRMEAAFAELAKSYYQSCIKLVRSHRDHLNKTTHQLLFVRHQFKLGFYSELRQDPLSATKQYRTAYANLLEIRSSPYNLYEIRTIAGFINYKISKLCFMGNFPLDAISSFKKHVDLFRNKVECPALEFEHMKWLSNQNAIFAHLFEQSVAAGLVPSQSQHPGFYYFEAAMAAIDSRRKLAILMQGKEQVSSEASICEPVAASVPMEYFGQRAWRPGCQALETLDPEKEASGIRALQVAESTVNHTLITIGLLSSAITHFKKNKCMRLRRYMTVLIAEEYFSSGDYASVLAALTPTLPAYKNDHWLHISRSILVTCLKAAFHLGNGQEFRRIADEFLTSEFPVSPEERQTIEEAVSDLTSGRAPASLPASWHVSPMSDVKWSFTEDVVNANPVTNSTQNNSSLSFFIASGSVRCRSSNGHEFHLSGTSSASQPHEPQAVPPESSPAQVTINGESESRQEINSHPVPQSNLLQVGAIVPRSGTSRTPIQITFSFLNLTLADLPLELSIGNNDNFMFSGNKQINLLLSAGASQTQTYILYPLVCGFVNLPKLRVVAFPDSPHAQPLDALVETALPQFIQIMPKGS